MNAEAAAETRKSAGLRTGTVLSDKRDKTRTVAVEYQVKHPKFGKYVRRRAKFHVHDEKNESHLGDRVVIASCRPLSKMKSWRLVKVLERGVTEEHRTEA